MPRDDLLVELQALQLASRQLSRAIGTAKRSGQDIGPLLQERKALGLREEALQARLEPNPSGPLTGGPAAAPEAQPAAAPVVDTSPVATPAQPLGEVTASLAGPEDWADWDRFVDAAPDASLYHASGWQGVIRQAFGHDCPYLVARRAGQVVGVLPLVRLQSRLFGHFMVSVPFFNYGGALTSDPAARDALLAEATRLAAAQGCSHIELRDMAPLEGWPARTDKVSMWLKLPASADALWSQLGSKLRAQIKKAQGVGLRCETGGVELLDDFYRVFSINMRDLGTPVYGKDFFARVLRHAPGDPVLVLGRAPDGQAVSAALLLRHRRRMEVPWASTLRSANPWNANMALYWHMLQHACVQGCDTFDFGRSTRDAPTYRFKKQWGAEPVPLHWHYWLAGGGALPKLNPDNPKFRAAIAVWQRLPVWLTRLIGPHVVKHLP